MVVEILTSMLRFGMVLQGGYATALQEATAPSKNEGIAPEDVASDTSRKLGSRMAVAALKAPD